MDEPTDFTSLGEHCVIKSVCSHERIMAAPFGYASIFNDKDLVRILHGIETMCDAGLAPVAALQALQGSPETDG